MSYIFSRRLVKVCSTGFVEVFGKNHIILFINFFFAIHIYVACMNWNENFLCFFFANEAIFEPLYFLPSSICSTTIFIVGGKKKKFPFCLLFNGEDKRYREYVASKTRFSCILLLCRHTEIEHENTNSFCCCCWSLLVHNIRHSLKATLFDWHSQFQQLHF